MKEESLRTWPDPIITPDLEKKGRVAVCAPWGQLGIRAMGALLRQPDIEVVYGIIHYGKTVKLRGRAFLEAYPDVKLFVAEEDIEDRDLLRSDGICMDVWNDELFGDINLIFDFTRPEYGTKFIDKAVNHGVVCILQSGRVERGRLFVPPRIAPGEEIIYQMGECNINAATPVLAALDGIIDTALIDVHMQYAYHWRGRIRDENIEATYFTFGDSLQKQLKTLFPHLELRVNDITMSIGKRIYTQKFYFETIVPVDKGEVVEMLNHQPRVRCLPDARDTHAVREYSNSLEATGATLPPITPIFIRDGSPYQKSRKITMVVAVDSRRITVPPNVDAARILLFGTDPVEAMRLTDQTMNYATISR